jgi:hypothetical protein
VCVCVCVHCPHLFNTILQSSQEMNLTKKHIHNTWYGHYILLQSSTNHLFCTVSGIILIKPAHCSNAFGPMPFSCFNCCRLMNEPLVERHSIIFSALEEFKPAILLKMYKKKYSFKLLLMVKNHAAFHSHKLCITKSLLQDLNHIQHKNRLLP